MNILVIDTATEACSVALETAAGIEHRFEVCPQEHSRKLLPMVQDVLQVANVSLADIDALAVGIGPGSFTGVRIAMGMVQGLAFGADLPIVKVSTLQAMAQQCFEQEEQQSVVSLIDARMSEVYFAHYQSDINGVMQLQGEELVIAPDVLIEQKLQHFKGYGAAGTGWPAYESLLALHCETPQILYPNALYMLPMAKQQFSQHQTFTAREIEPTYLRDKVTWKKLPGRE